MDALSSSPPVPTKPWSSGRVLTSSQREAKRRKDRVTKRLRVQKQKESIQDLRNQISALQSLTQKSLDHLIVPESNHIRSGDIISRLHGNYIFTGLENQLPSSIPLSLQEDKCCSLLQFGNDLFSKVHDLGIHTICLNDQLNQDAVIRGVLEGWHVIQGRAYFCPLWSILEQIDERIFIRSGILTRFSMLRMIHLMLQANIYAESFPSLPVWYRPRPTQLAIPHFPTADYFAWPGFRERLVMSDCDILTDRFYKYFTSCFRLFWPYSIDDAYHLDQTTNMYLFSDTFDRHIRDINMWTFSEDFFKVFPHLLDDMQREKPTETTMITPGSEHGTTIPA